MWQFEKAGGPLILDKFYNVLNQLLSVFEVDIGERYRQL